MNTLAVIAGLAIALWITYRYEAIGTVGGAGVAIAALPFLQHRASFLDLIVLGLAGSAFTIGMLLGPKKTDKQFHWSALAVNALPWAVMLYHWVVDWSGWQDQSTAPTVIMMTGVACTLVVGAWIIVSVTKRIKQLLNN